MRANKVRIAVVDDDGSFRRALKRLLTASGFDVEAFASGREFLDSLASHLPDCLLLDLQMPGLNALQVQRALATMEISLPTIVVTAHDEPESKARCLAGGASAYFRKPVERAELVAAIRSSVRGGSASI